MKSLAVLFLTFALAVAQAEDKMKMYFNNEEILKIIELYSKASGQKFVIDPGVRGKVSLFLQEPVPVEEAFNHLSSALALNGFAISKQGDTMVILSARNIQRNLIEVSSNPPTLKPERMYSWIYTPKYISVEAINRDLRILPSKDGELAINPTTNQIVFSDWTSNLTRVHEVLKEIDKPLDAATIKLVQAGKKEREEAQKARAKKDNKEDSKH